MSDDIRTGFFRLSLSCLIALAALGAASAWAAEGYSSSLPTNHPDQAGIEAAFDQAAAEYGVPAEILKAVAFAESRWVQYGPTVDGGWGIMHLVDNNYAHTMQDAATLSGETVEALKTDAVANIRGGAALLADLVGKTVGNAVTLADYRPALSAFTGLLPSVQDKQVQEYYRVLASGAQATNPLGMSINLAPSTLPAGHATAQPMDYVTMSTDYPPAIWNPAVRGNYSNGRGGNAITYWVNHWTDGTYANAISWFQNPSSVVSAHFVCRQIDGELTQMVRIADTAYHAGNWTYNQRSIGIEHEAWPSYSWPTTSSAPLLIVSTDACRYFCNLYGIPKTRSYIIGHQEVPGVATDCPGPLPWDLYMAMVTNSAPVIMTQPPSQQVCPGEVASFTIQAVGGGTLTYQWQKNSVNVTNGGHYLDCTTATLTVAACNNADVANYRCVVTNANGSTTSNNAALTLRPVTTVTQQPQPQVVAPGSTATFTVAATGYGTLSYQWRRYDTNLSNDSRISGVNMPTLWITNLNAGDVASYKCVVSTVCGSDVSDPASLTLNGVPGDFDGDGDVDLEDFGIFQACLSGPGVSQDDPACAGTHLAGNDSDVDAQDLSKFLGCMTGPGIPGSANCLN